MALTSLDVATFLTNEKRTDIIGIETRQNVKVILVPNPNIQTPHYEIQRVKDQDSQMRKSDSFQFLPKTDVANTFESVSTEVKQPEAAVKDVSHIRPHHNKKKKNYSFLKRLFNWIFGKKINKNSRKRYNNRNKKNFRGRNNNYRQNRDSKRDNRYKSDRNNRQAESNNRDPNRRRRNTSSKNDRTNERNHNSKKDRPSQNNSLTDINMQANEQTNFDRQDVKRDDLEDKLDKAANNFNQNRVEETQKVDTLRDSAHSDSSQANFDEQKTGIENPESNESY